MEESHPDGDLREGRYRRILPRAPPQAGTAPTAPVSAIQSLMAPPQANARRRPTTSSERGKAFRARRRIYKGELEEQIRFLRDEIIRLEERKALLQTRVLEQRGSPTGSLARLVREYYMLFQHGMGDRRRALVDPAYALRNAADIAHKENFLRCVMAENAVTGDLIGPDASLMQWHFFSAAHARVNVLIDRVEIVGDPDDPFIHLYSTMTFLWGPHTLGLVFPGSERNIALVDAFENRLVTFLTITCFKFDSDDRICYEQVRTNQLEAYLRAGISLEAITEAFKYMIVSPSLTVKEDVAVLTPSASERARIEEDPERKRDEYMTIPAMPQSFGDQDDTVDERCTERSRRHWYIYEGAP